MKKKILIGGVACIATIVAGLIIRKLVIDYCHCDVDWDKEDDDFFEDKDFVNLEDTKSENKDTAKKEPT